MEGDASRPLAGARPGLSLRQAVPYLAATAVAAVVVGVVVLATSGASSAVPPAPPAAVYSSACADHPSCSGLAGECCPTEGGVLLACCSAVPSSAELDPFYGMCYAPTPTKTAIPDFPTDDFMGTWARPLWDSSPPWRDDLSIIRGLNATVVRLYGNDPGIDHTAFLNRAQELGLGVIVALSNFPYTQDPLARCGVSPPYDCYDEINSQYWQMLRRGFTVVQKDGTRVYHAAIKAIILVNEPELVITYGGSNTGESRSQGYYTKVVISALDGALSAEKQLKVVPGRTGHLPPFTVTYSFDTCANCISQQRGQMAGGRQVGGAPSLAFMFDLVLATLSPASFQYPNAHNDLRSAMQNRFVLGFNTQDTTDVICDQFVNAFANSPLSSIPLWAGEYKAHWQSLPNQDTSLFEQDLKKMRSFVDGPTACAASSPLRGVSVFEFQVAYWKGDADQLSFGIFELGSTLMGKTAKVEQTRWQEYDVWCLQQKRNTAGQSWVTPVAQVFGGTVAGSGLCTELASGPEPVLPSASAVGSPGYPLGNPELWA